MVFNDPAGANGPPDHSLRILNTADDIPNIYGILLDTIDSGPLGSTDPVNAAVDRKGAFRIDQLEVAAGSTVTVAQCASQMRDLGFYLEGPASFGQ